MRNIPVWATRYVRFSHVDSVRGVKDFTKARVKAETKFYSLSKRKGATNHRQYSSCGVIGIRF
jgi:hypothetical protein